MRILRRWAVRPPAAVGDIEGGGAAAVPVVPPPPHPFTRAISALRCPCCCSRPLSPSSFFLWLTAGCACCWTSVLRQAVWCHSLETLPPGHGARLATGPDRSPTNQPPSTDLSSSCRQPSKTRTANRLLSWPSRRQIHRPWCFSSRAASDVASSDAVFMLLMGRARGVRGGGVSKGSTGGARSKAWIATDGCVHRLYCLRRVGRAQGRRTSSHIYRSVMWVEPKARLAIPRSVSFPIQYRWCLGIEFITLRWGE